ncbi:hypothetical protein CARUB_v10019606mg, partial [Capsella rubella]
MWRLTAKESKFLRVDVRGLYDYRKLTINFGTEYGSLQVQLGQTHVMGFVTTQLVQPYKDRPNEGSLSIFTEFSPMADPSFEPGLVLGNLQESRAVHRILVWSVRIDLHILNNGGNLVDASNIPALPALVTFRRPVCTVGENGQEVIIHPPERMTVTVNANGDICAIQKPGEEGLSQSVILHCMRLASSRAAATTKIIRKEVEAYNREKSLKKVKRHPTLAKSEVSGPTVAVKEGHRKSSDQERAAEISREHVERLDLCEEKLRSNTKEEVATKQKGWR